MTAAVKMAFASVLGLGLCACAPNGRAADQYILPWQYYNCEFGREFDEAHLLADLPAPVSDAFLGQLSRSDDRQRSSFREAFPDREWPIGMEPGIRVIADRGADRGGGIGYRRWFIRAGGDNAYWFVWYENHGATRTTNIVLFEVGEGTAQIVSKTASSGNICRETESLITNSEIRAFTGFW